MIVVFIIGLMAGLISLSMSDDKSKTPPRLEAQALIQAIGFASEFAVLNGEMVALFINRKPSEDSASDIWCYDWRRYRDGNWGVFAADSLSEHCLDERVQWELIVEGQAYNFDPDLEVQPPVLVFSPSGEATAVEMALFDQTGSENTQHIDIDLMGNSRWREDDAQKREELKP